MKQDFDELLILLIDAARDGDSSDLARAILDIKKLYDNKGK